MSYCPSCGASINDADQFFASCGESLTVARGFPGVLWLLPIFFGFIGGIIAALIAGLKYEASWWGLFVVGIITQTLAVIVWVSWWVTILAMLTA